MESLKQANRTEKSNYKESLGFSILHGWGHFPNCQFLNIPLNVGLQLNTLAPLHLS